MKKLLILAWALLTLGILFAIDYWIGLWRSDPFSFQPPNLYLHFMIGLFGIGSLMGLFRYITGFQTGDFTTGILLTLAGLLVTLAPLLFFSIESLSGAGRLVTSQGLLWPAGIMILYTGGLLLKKKHHCLGSEDRLSLQFS